MISGAHAVIYSQDPDADRAFFQQILKLPNVDAGGGWLIFGLPPSEVAVHPADSSGKHELILMSDDIHAFAAAMANQNVPCEPVQDQPWGMLTQITLPGGGQLGVYEPKHERPENPD